MKITSVKVNKYDREDSKMVGTASVVLDDCFIVRNIRIIAKEDGGYLVAMPSRRTADGEYKDIAHPLNSETRKMFEDAILDAYNNIEE